MKSMLPTIEASSEMGRCNRRQRGDVIVAQQREPSAHLQRPAMYRRQKDDAVGDYLTCEQRADSGIAPHVEDEIADHQWCLLRTSG